MDDAHSYSCSTIMEIYDRFWTYGIESHTIRILVRLQPEMVKNDLHVNLSWQLVVQWRQKHLESMMLNETLSSESLKL